MIETREKMIKILTNMIKEHPEFDASEISALKFAIDGIKTDLAYDIEYENLDCVIIPEGATNGEVLTKMLDQAFPDVKMMWLNDEYNLTKTLLFTREFWDALYKRY